MPEQKTAARLISEALVANGVERIFCVPGESYLALLDALYDTKIAVTVFRHEGAAAMAAEAWGKLTGHPGIVMVTRGPGATNASGGIHVARQDSTPVIMFVGQVGCSDACAPITDAITAGQREGERSKRSSERLDASQGHVRHASLPFCG